MARYYPRGPAPIRFWTKVNFTDSCWLWTGSRNLQGYGQWPNAFGSALAHRYAYTFCVGPIPDGLEIDHLCRVPLCVNPDHLEPVTHRENQLRGTGQVALNARKTHCVHGHAFTPSNTYIWRSERHCRLCRKLRARAINADSYGGATSWLA